MPRCTVQRPMRVQALQGAGRCKRVRTEAEKYLLMGTLNLVECVAFVSAFTADR